MFDDTTIQTEWDPTAEAIAEAELAHAPEDISELPISPWRERLSTAVAISLGAILGANARYAVGIWIAARWGTSFPWGTFLVNIIGSFILGFYLTLVTERFTGRAITRLFVATGFLGAFTTFSTFSYELTTMFRGDTVLTAFTYLGASLLIGIGGVIVGIFAAHAL